MSDKTKTERYYVRLINDRRIKKKFRGKMAEIIHEEWMTGWLYDKDRKSYVAIDLPLNCIRCVYMASMAPAMLFRIVRFLRDLIGVGYE